MHRRNYTYTALQILLPKIIDPHCCKVLRNQILDYVTKRELYRWLALEPCSLMQYNAPYPDQQVVDLSINKERNEKNIRDTQNIGLSKEKKNMNNMVENNDEIEDGELPADEIDENYVSSKKEGKVKKKSRSRRRKSIL